MKILRALCNWIAKNRHRIEAAIIGTVLFLCLVATAIRVVYFEYQHLQALFH